MRHLEIWGSCDTALVALDGEPMILRCDKYPSRFDFLHRVVSTPVPIRHLRGLAAERKSQQLMAEADPERGYAVGCERPDRFLGIGDRSGIARTIREKDSVRIMRERVFRRSVRGHNRDPAVALREEPKNVAFDSVIVREDVVSRARVSPGIGLPRRDARGEIQTLHRWTRLESSATRFIGFRTGADDPSHDPDGSDVSRETSSVNFFEDGDLGGCEPGT